MKKTFIFFILNITIFSVSIAQEVEHNYLVGPQITNCDSLDINKLHLSEAISLIRTSRFRFDQSFRLTRKHGLQGAEYYSCDNKHGFLIVKYDNIDSLYLGFDKLLWREFIASSDPEGYYLRMKSNLLKYP